MNTCSELLQRVCYKLVESCAGLEPPQQQLSLPGPRRHGALMAEAADFKAASDPALPAAAAAARAALDTAEHNWVRLAALRLRSIAALAAGRSLAESSHLTWFSS